MKKILVVLLILAVAGGVFAQEGSWSINGKIEIGTRVDFDPNPEQDGDDDPALIGATAYNTGWDKIWGKLGVSYERDVATIGLDFTTADAADFTTSFHGDSFRAQFSYKLPAALGWGGNVERLWGEYKFLNDMVTLYAANNSENTEYWYSDKTGNFKDKMSGWKTDHDIFADGGTFTDVDHKNYFLTNVELGALNFGLMMPSVFHWRWGEYEWNKVDYEDTFGHETKTPPEFVNDSLKKLILGVSFSQSPFEFAAQFDLANYGVYFGGKFFAGPITIGFSAKAILDGDALPPPAPQADPQHVKIGGVVSYNGDGFGGGLKAFYDKEDYAMRTGATSDWYLSTIGVEPYFFYDAIPSHLQFNLTTGFYFFNETDGNSSTKATVWALQPQIFWNFLGTGASGSYDWGNGTGIIIRYRLANADTRDLERFGGGVENYSANVLDVVFKWGF